MVNDSNCAYSAVTLAASRVSYGSYSIVSRVDDVESFASLSVSSMDEASSPLIVIEGVADEKVFVMYCLMVGFGG